MLSIKTRIKIKEFKKKLISIWYVLMKPVAYTIDKVEEYKYKHNQNKIKKWTDEYAMKLYVKIVIKQLIKWKREWEEFVVAEWCNDDYGLRTVVDEIWNQNYNKNLRSWVYKLPWRDVDRVEKLTELLRLELEKYKEIKCEYVIEKDMYDYKARDYRKTLVVKLNTK